MTPVTWPLDYPAQVAELEKMARLSPPSPSIQRALPGLADLDEDDAGCLVCGAWPARACAACSGVRYCGEDHQRVDARWHDPVCADLQAIAEDAAFSTSATRASAVDALVERLGHASIDALAGWDDLLDPAIVGPRRRLLTDLASRPLTLARALADLDVPTRSARPGALTIHVMAAAEPELRVPPALWAALGRLSQGARLELALIGPELDHARARAVEVDDAALSLRVHAGLYRRALWSALGRPDLVIGYDCGILLYPAWKATIVDLRGSGVPFVITSYRPWEAAAEARLLTAVGVQPLRAPAANPFASLACRRSRTIANDVAHDNAWVSAWR